jgi:hypothetical protein
MSSLQTLFYRTEARANKFSIKDDKLKFMGPTTKHTQNITKWTRIFFDELKKKCA